MKNPETIDKLKAMAYQIQQINDTLSLFINNPDPDNFWIMKNKLLDYQKFYREEIFNDLNGR